MNHEIVELPLKPCFRTQSPWPLAGLMVTAICAAIIVAAPAALRLCPERPVWDETYVWNATRAFSAHLNWDFVKTYDGLPLSSGPLYLLVNVGWSRTFGPSLSSLRAFSCLCSLIAVVALTEVLAILRCRRRVWLPIAACLVGYNYGLSMPAMTEMPLLASLLAGTWCFLVAVRSGRPWLHVGTVLFWTYAIDVKVLAAYWLAACGLWLLHTVGKDLRGLAAVAIPVAVHLPLYLTWHALLPPTQDKAFLGIAAVPGFHLGHFNHAIVLLGIYFWPVVLCGLKRPPVRWLMLIGWAGILLSLWLLFPPDYQGQVYLGAARGIVARMHLLDHARTVLFLPWVVGVVVAMVFARNALAPKDGSARAIQLATLIVAGGIAAIVVAPAAWDRYFMPFWPVALLLAVEALDGKPRATFLLVAYNALMAVVLMARYGGVG